MANTKNKKSTGLRSNEYLPKAGPKSSNGGRNQRHGLVATHTGPDLFTQLREDRVKANEQMREEAKLAAAAKQLAFRRSQADRALSLLNLPDGLTRSVAVLLIENFVTVTPTVDNKFIVDGKDVKRTGFAELQVLDQLSPTQLRQKQAVDNGRFGARRVLSMAYDQLTQLAPVEEPKTLQATSA